MKIKSIAAAVTLAFASQGVSAMNICTGSGGGGYERLGYAIAGNLKGSPSVINTNGSLDNIQRFDDKECDIAIVQMDALSVQPPKRPFKSKTAHEEAVYWFYNQKHDLKDLEDVEGKEKEYSIVVVNDSGADVTMRSFVQEDSGYEGLYKTAILADDMYDAADIASEGVYDGNNGQKKVAGFLYVTRPGSFSSDIVSDFKNTLAIGELTDGDFNDAEAFGEKLYKDCSIKKEHTKGMTRATLGDQDTVCMNAKVIFPKDDIEGYKNRDIKRAINKALR